MVCSTVLLQCSFMCVHSCVFSIGVVHLDQGMYTTAVMYFRKSLETIADRDDRATARAYHNIGEVYTRQNDLGNALKMFEKAFDLQRFGRENVYTVKIRESIALVYCQQGKHDKAIELLKDVLAVKTKVLGEEHLETSRSQHKYAHMHAGLY